VGQRRSAATDTMNGLAGVQTGAAIESLQSYQLLLYRKALHPELFPVRARLAKSRPGHDLEAWVMPGGHLLRFRHGGLTCCELLIDQPDHLPVDGAVTACSCIGDHDFQHKFLAERVAYMATVQHEVLSESLYNETYDDIIGSARAAGALITEWCEPANAGSAGAGPGLGLGRASGLLAQNRGQRCATILEVESWSKGVHADSSHLLGGSGVIIRTQTLFEHR
jgi:hypothetical protein